MGGRVVALKGEEENGVDSLVTEESLTGEFALLDATPEFVEPPETLETLEPLDSLEPLEETLDTLDPLGSLETFDELEPLNPFSSLGLADSLLPRSLFEFSLITDSADLFESSLFTNSADSICPCAFSACFTFINGIIFFASLAFTSSFLLTVIDAGDLVILLLTSPPSERGISLITFIWSSLLSLIPDAVLSECNLFSSFTLKK